MDPDAMAVDVDVDVDDIFAELSKNGWRPEIAEMKRSVHKLRADDRLTATKLVENFLTAEMDIIQNQKMARSLNTSLAALSIDAMIDAIDKSDDVDGQIRFIASSLDWLVLRDMLLSGRLPYVYLRKFFDLTPHDEIKSLDLDLAVLRHTQYFSSIRHDKARATKFLFRIEALEQLIPSNTSVEEGLIEFERMRPPRGGLELFDHNRQIGPIKLHSTIQLFTEKFDEIFGVFWKELEWSNMVVVGPAVITCIETLRRPQPESDEMAIVCLYGLGPKEANAKVQNIYETLQETFPGETVYIQKTPNFTTLMIHNQMSDSDQMSDSESVRIQIVHRCFRSIEDVLAAFEIDAGGALYNGQDVFLTARCIRALETGFSTITAELAHQLQEHNPRFSLLKVWQLAELGYGLRILPDFISSLTETPTCRFKGLEQIRFIGAVTRACFKHHMNSVADPIHSQTTMPFEDFLKQWQNSCGKSEPLEKLLLDSSGHSDLMREAMQAISHNGFSTFKSLVWFCELYSYHGQASLMQENPPDIEGLGLFEVLLKPYVQYRLGRSTVRADYTNYLTRRIRTAVSSENIDDYRKKQIVIPLIIPKALEEMLVSLWESYITVEDSSTTPILIPVYNSAPDAQAQQSLPGLVDTDSEIGNLRYWVTGLTSLWRGHNKARDRIHDVLEALKSYTYHESPVQADNPVNTPLNGREFEANSVWFRRHLLAALRRLGSGRYFRTGYSSPSDTESRLNTSGVVSADEARVFRSWVYADPSAMEAESRFHSPGEVFVSLSKWNEVEGDILDEVPWHQKFGDDVTWNPENPYQWVPYNDEPQALFLRSVMSVPPLFVAYQ